MATPTDEQKAAVAKGLYSALKKWLKQFGDATGFDFALSEPKQVGSGFEFAFRLHAFQNKQRTQELDKAEEDQPCQSQP